MAHFSPTHLKQPCCTSSPRVDTSRYVSKGHEVVVDDLVLYVTGNSQCKRVLIAAYDIFGYHRNVKEFCDRLAEEGNFRVILPDFYRGDYWRTDRSIQVYYSWINYIGTWDVTTKKDVLRVIQHYKNEGATSFGMFGFCWGGKMSVLAGLEIPDIKVIGLVHPSAVRITDANHINVPVIILPSKEEIDFVPFYTIMVDRLGEDFCTHHRFNEMEHGFCGARGDFNDSATKKAVGEVIGHLNVFFNNNLPPDISESDDH